MTEQHTIHLPVIRYRDQAGNPTCAADFEIGDVCKFYRTQRMGCGETCVFAETGTRSKYADNMDRRDGVQGPGMGTLIPGAWCPVWPQRSVAHALGIKHIQQVSEWERGDVRPGRKHLAKLAEVLGLEIADLLPRIQPDLGANQ